MQWQQTAVIGFQARRVSQVDWNAAESFLRATAYMLERVCHANSVCPSVCPSVTRVYCVKTAERIIEILSPSDRPNILVFRHQRSLRKSDGFTPVGAPNRPTRGVAKTSNFRPICGYISERVLDRSKLLWKTNIKSYVLYRIVPLSMTLSDPEPKFKGHSIV